MHQVNERLWRSYDRSLRALNRSVETIESYHKAVRELDAYLKGSDITEASKKQLQGYLTKRLSEISATTVGIRFRSLRAMFNWMVEEQIIDVSPLKGVREPKAADNPPEVLSDDDLLRLLKACSGKDFESRRDDAIIRVMCESGGPRLGEVTGMDLDSLDLTHDLLKVTGKGSKTRLIPFGAKCGISLDRYLRLRSKHPQKASQSLWLGRKGPLSASGIAQMLNRRARQAGLGRIHPHQLRHTSAHRWMESGGSEGDAMMLFGWSSPDMPKRYGRSAGISRAQNASRRVSLGDRL